MPPRPPHGGRDEAHTCIVGRCDLLRGDVVARVANTILLRLNLPQGAASGLLPQSTFQKLPALGPKLPIV